MYEQEDILYAGRNVWWEECNVHDWFEAFKAHPRIGNVEDLKKKFANNTTDLCSNEQSAAMQSSTENIINDLKMWNDKYYDKYGFIFIIFATGKSAEEVLFFLKERYGNSAMKEATNAAIEQMKITELRLSKLFPNLFPEEASSSEEGEKKKPGFLARTGKILAHLAGNPQSPVTSHVLDIANGKPAKGVPIKLERLMPCSTDAWDLVGKDVTNGDGRATKLLEPSDYIEAGTYRISFDTRSYEKNVLLMDSKALGFYPHASIVFEIGENQTHQHFHVPLLYAPYGYSTYRGS